MIQVQSGNIVSELIRQGLKLDLLLLAITIAGNTYFRERCSLFQNCFTFHMPSVKVFFMMARKEKQTYFSPCSWLWLQTVPWQQLQWWYTGIRRQGREMPGREGTSYPKLINSLRIKTLLGNQKGENWIVSNKLLKQLNACALRKKGSNKNSTAAEKMLDRALWWHIQPWAMTSKRLQSFSSFLCNYCSQFTPGKSLRAKPQEKCNVLRYHEVWMLC